MKRACLLVISALVLLLPSAAQGAKPERVPPPDELLDFTFDAGTVCPFELRYQELVNNETTTQLSETQRRVTGAYKVRLTNTATGKSLAVNASGPQFFTDTGDIEMAVLPGRQLFLLFPTDAGGPGAFLATGRSTLVRDFAAERITSVSFGGHVTDLCVALT